MTVKGGTLSPESRMKLSIANKGKHLSPETKAKIGAASRGNHNTRGRHLTPEHIAKIRLATTGKHRTPEQIAHLIAAQIGRRASPEARAHMSAAHKGKDNHCTGKHRSRETWQKVLRSQIHKQTKPEHIVELWLNDLFPEQYRYEGSSSSTIINYCRPDFININGQKKVIEVFGDYWHGEKKTGKAKEKEELDKINTYREVGFQCLVIWEIDIMNTPEKIKKQIVAFHKTKQKHIEIQPCLI